MASLTTYYGQSLSVFLFENEFVFKGKILDAGCGRKPWKRMMKGRDDVEWVGVDKLPGRGDIEADLHELPFEDNSFDTLLCIDVMHQVKDPVKVLGELARVTKPSGLGLITFTAVFPDEGNLTEWRFSEAGCRFILHDAGFETLTEKKIAGQFKQYYDSFCRDRKNKKDENIVAWLEGLEDLFPMAFGFVVRKK